MICLGSGAPRSAEPQLVPGGQSEQDTRGESPTLLGAQPDHRPGPSRPPQLTPLAGLLTEGRGRLPTLGFACAERLPILPVLLQEGFSPDGASNAPTTKGQRDRDGE